MWWRRAIDQCLTVSGSFRIRTGSWPWAKSVVSSFAYVYFFLVVVVVYAYFIVFKATKAL